MEFSDLAHWVKECSKHEIVEFESIHTEQSQRRRGDHQEFIRILLDPGYKFWIYDFEKSKPRVG